ncbi:hypothetical protein V6N13_127276 [Hibiscus sabdariffa]
MPWYTVGDRLLIEKPAIRFIKEVWHLKSKPILVVLDSTGEVFSPNAMLIWGSSAFPFHKFERREMDVRSTRRRHRSNDPHLGSSFPDQHEDPGKHEVSSMQPHLGEVH